MWLPICGGVTMQPKCDIDNMYSVWFFTDFSLVTDLWLTFYWLVTHFYYWLVTHFLLTCDSFLLLTCDQLFTDLWLIFTIDLWPTFYWLVTVFYYWLVTTLWLTFNWLLTNLSLSSSVMCVTWIMWQETFSCVWCDICVSVTFVT